VENKTDASRAMPGVPFTRQTNPIPQFRNRLAFGKLIA
jgi:hypothetical protein